MYAALFRYAALLNTIQRWLDHDLDSETHADAIYSLHDAIWANSEHIPQTAALPTYQTARALRGDTGQDGVARVLVHVLDLDAALTYPDELIASLHAYRRIRALIGLDEPAAL